MTERCWAITTWDDSGGNATRLIKNGHRAWKATRLWLEELYRDAKGRKSIWEGRGLEKDYRDCRDFKWAMMDALMDDGVCLLWKGNWMSIAEVEVTA